MDYQTITPINPSHEESLFAEINQCGWPYKHRRIKEKKTKRFVISLFSANVTYYATISLGKMSRAQQAYGIRCIEY